MIFKRIGLISFLGFLGALFSITGFAQTQLIQNTEFLKPNISGNASEKIALEIYEEAEIGIALKPIYETQFAPGGSRNPYAPEDITLFGKLINPATRELLRTYHAFYFIDFLKDTSGQSIRDKIVAGDYNFRLRFALETIGEYELEIYAQNLNELPVLFQTYTLEGKPNESQNLGFLEFSGNYLNFSSSKDASFFPIGNGLTFYSYNAMADDGRPRNQDYPNGTHSDYSSRVIEDFERLLSELSDNGANHVGLMLNSYNFDIEWGWEWNSTKDVVKYHDYLYRARDIDTILEMCKRKGIYVRLCLFNHKKFKNPSSSGAHTLYNWENSPYKTLPAVDDESDFFTDSLAIKLADRKIRYVLSRWGYHTNLPFIEIINEVDQTSYDYWGAHRIAINKWVADRAKTAKKYAPVKLISASTSALFAGKQLFDEYSEAFDFSIYHAYSDKRNVSHHHGRAGKYYRDKFEMPFICGELGVAGQESDTCGFINSHQPHNSVHHNNIWSTSFSGAFGSGMIYYWGVVHLYPNTAQSIQHYFPLSTFFSNENLNAHSWKAISTACTDDPNNTDPDDCRPHTWSPYDELNDFIPTGIKITDSTDQTEVNVEAYALKSRERILGWVHHLDSYYLHLLANSGGRCDLTKIDVSTISERFMSVYNLDPGDIYKIEWWNTHPWYDANQNQLDDDWAGGKITESSIDPFSQTAEVNTDGVLKIPIPPLAPLAKTGSEKWAPDYGFKLIRTGNSGAGDAEVYLKCYPNPIANSKLNIEFSFAEKAAPTISIVNLLGQKVRVIEKIGAVTNAAVSVETAGLSSGVYFLVLEIDGHILKSEKVVIQ